MNTIGTTQNQDTANTLLANATDLIKNLAKPSESMQVAPASSILELPDELISLLVNLIEELRSNATGSIDTKGADVATGAEGSSKSDGGILNSTPLPSFMGSVTTSTTSTPSASGNSGERTLNVAPLPSLVSPTTGNLSTTELPKAFNPPAIPSLLGGSTSLPTVNAVASESAPVTTGLTTASAENASTGRTLNVAPLPSLVSPTTGSLSTTELPKAFNPPAIPSLLGNSTTLPTVNAASNAIGSNDTSGIGSSRIFVPSLTGNATLSALSSADGFSASGASGIVDGSGLSASENTSRPRTNHFK